MTKSVTCGLIGAMTPTAILTLVLSLTPSITAILTPTLLPTPTEVIIQASPAITLAATSAPAAAAGSLSTLFWAVLILLGGAILGIFGFLMGQGQRKES